MTPEARKAIRRKEERRADGQFSVLAILGKIKPKDQNEPTGK